jgi:hypothetical protein
MLFLSGGAMNGSIAGFPAAKREFNELVDGLIHPILCSTLWRLRVIRIDP